MHYLILLFFFSSTITFDAQSKIKTKSFREINFSLLKIDRILYLFIVIWNLFEQKIFAFLFLFWKFIRTRNICFCWKFFVKRNFSFDLIIACCLNCIEMIWKNIIIVIFAFDKFELIEIFAKIVTNTSNWRLFLDFFFKNLFRSFFVELSMILWLELFVNLCVVLNIYFHANDLIESNCCKINVFKNISWIRFVDVWKFDRFLTVVFSWNIVCVLTWNQKIKFIDDFVNLYNDSFVSTFTFAHFSISKKRKNIFCFFVCIFWKKTNVNDNSWNA